MAPPGMFWNLRGSASMPHAELDLLVGGVDSAYRTPGGDCPTDRFLVSTHLDLEEGRCRLSTGFDFAVGTESFAPAEVVPTRETIHALLERGFRLGRRSVVRCTLEVDKRVDWDELARREESTQCRVEAQALLGSFDAAAELRCSRTDGFGATLTASLRPLPRDLFRLEAGIDGLCAGGPAVTILGSARFGMQGRAYALEAGVADWKPDGNMQGLLQHLRFCIGWGISERGEKSAHVS